MKHKVTFVSVVLVCFTATCLFGQGLTSLATKDDWEEINFEFNSSVLVDGYPSLLRLGELLQQHPDFHVTLEGHTDSVGSRPFNDKLSRARAEAVREFLVRNGAREGQIQIVGQGLSQPRVPNTTNEGRFINRRVTMIVRDGQGRTVSAAGAAEAIKAMEEHDAALKKAVECCEDVQNRLRQIESLPATVTSLGAGVERLQQDFAAMLKQQSAMEKQIAALPRAVERAEMAKMMEDTAERAIERAKPNRFSLLALNIGPSLNEVLRPQTVDGTQQDVKQFGRGNVTVNARGRYFAPFGKTEMHALQADVEYLYYRDRQEGQFDIGLVNRFNRVQLGLFSSLKHAHLTNLGGATLGQGAITLDYLFSRGRVGVFGTKGYLDERVVAREPLQLANGLISYNVFDETYLKIVDQIGASTQFGAWGDAYIDANAGALFRQGGSNRAGATVRLVQPFHPNWAFTVEASLNETMVASNNTGRVAVGIQFGNWVRPKETLNVRHPVPADVPRLRWEVLTRRVRVGNAIPVADAGPDQTAAAGTVTLDGGGSFDPDGDTLTYQWTQTSGPAVTLSDRNASVASFTAAAGQVYTFRLTVRDTEGAQATDSVTINTMASAGLLIVRFTAAPSEILSGERSTLVWQVEGATSVNISGIGTVGLTGALDVMPETTTTYVLTARNQQGEATANATVTVQGRVVITSFTATPMSAEPGTPVVLAWTTENATSATLSGIGTVQPNGSVTVHPTVPTTYVLTALGNRSQDIANLTVQVGSSSSQQLSCDAGPSQTTTRQSLTLDATASREASGGLLTYEWRLLGTGLGAEIINGDTATPTVRFLGGLGQYIFQVTVTNTLGGRCTATTIVNYIDP